MVTMNGILNISSRGLEAAKAGLDVTGQNIANANTEGFSRQRIVQRATNPLVTTQGVFGQGVEVVSVERIRDAFLEAQIRGVQSDKSFNEELDNLFLRIEAVLNDPLAPIGNDDATDQGGLNNLLSRFFQSLNDLSATPDRPETRQAVVDNAFPLSQTFNFAAEELNTIKQDLNERVVLFSEAVNQKTAEVAALNQRIAITEVGGQPSNDLRDQRDVVLSELSEIIPIKTSDGGNGTIDVTLAGQRIVDGIQQTPLKIQFVDEKDSPGLARIRIGNAGLNVEDDMIRKGKLGATLDARDRLIPFLQEEMNTLARGVMFEINKIHSESSGLEGLVQLQTSFSAPDKETGDISGRSLDQIFNFNSTRTNIDSRLKTFPVEDGSFSIRVTDDENNTRDIFDVTVNTSDSLRDIAERINRSDGIVSQAQSTLTFDPVFVRRATAEVSIANADIAIPLFQQTALASTPAAENPANPQSFEIHVRNAGGSLVDTDTTTQAIDPITVNFTGVFTLQQLATEIQNSSNGLVRASVVDSQNDADASVLQIETVNQSFSLSIQNDTSGVINALEIPLTDPNIPLIGGVTTQAAAEFAGDPAVSFFGAGDPAFSAAFPGPPPNVLEEGSFEFVVLDNNNVPTVTNVVLQRGGIETLSGLEAFLEAANPNINVEITADNRFVITADNKRSFFFQNDDTGIVEAMKFDQISGTGLAGNSQFVDGSFEIVVADETGTVQNIVEVPITADPSTVGGIVSINDVINSINSAASRFAAPVRASLVESAADPTRSVIQLKSNSGFEFTLRSDDSFLLSALGFTDGPVLAATSDPPLVGASSVVGIGDSIGGVIRAKITNTNDIEIQTTEKERVTFIGDDSNFLAAAGINSFFQGSNAATMKVNNALIENTNLLASSRDGNPGNNEAAQAMAELEAMRVLNDKTFAETFRSTIATLGVEGSRARQFSETNTAILRELQVLQEQQSGVSLDEESINLIKFQQAFQASARMINTVDQLMDIIINQIGG